MFKSTKVLLPLILLITFTSLYAIPQKTQANINNLKNKLNSERIQDIFGIYAVELLPINSKNFPDARISNLHSLDKGRKITRTLAIVDFFGDLPQELQECHKKIVAGGSIGSTLKGCGFKIAKAPVYFGEHNTESSIYPFMNIKESLLPLHIYELRVEKDSLSSTKYCTIIELHHPDYLDFAWLKLLYPANFETYTKKNQNVEKIMRKISLFLKDELKTISSNKI